MNTQLNLEGFMVMSKEYFATPTLKQAVNTNNFYQAELEFVKNWNAFGRQVFEELLRTN